MAEEVIKEQPKKDTIALPTNVMGVSDFAETQTYFPDTKEDSTTEQILNVRKALQKDIGYAVTFDESKHLKKLETKEVSNFGDDADDFSSNKPSTDFSLD